MFMVLTTYFFLWLIPNMKTHLYQDKLMFNVKLITQTVPRNRKPLQTVGCWFSASPWSSWLPTWERQKGRDKTTWLFTVNAENQKCYVHGDLWNQSNCVGDLTLKVLVKRQQRRDHIGRWRSEVLGTPTLCRNTHKPLMDKYTTIQA